jgi:hypothetical protein
MSKQPYPLLLPDELADQVSRTAAETGLTMAEAMRQAIRLGLPKVRKGLSTEFDHAEAAADTWEKLGPAPTVLYDEL